MNKKNRPLYLGLLAGLTLMGLGVSYQSLWCDPRSELAERDPRGLHTLSRDGVTVAFEARPLGSGGTLTEGSFANVRFTITDRTAASHCQGCPLAPGWTRR